MWAGEYERSPHWGAGEVMVSPMVFDDPAIKEEP